MKHIISILLLSMFMTNISFCQVSTVQQKQQDVYTQSLSILVSNLQHSTEQIQSLKSELKLKDATIDKHNLMMRDTIIVNIFVLMFFTVIYVYQQAKISKLEKNNNTAIFSPLEEQALMRLAHYSFDEINWEYSGLTPNEKNCISKPTFSSIRDKCNKNTKSS